MSVDNPWPTETSNDQRTLAARDPDDDSPVAVRRNAQRAACGASCDPRISPWRAVGNSLTSRLLEISPVPVEVIAGAPAGVLERVGIPAGVGAGMAWLLVG